MWRPEREMAPFVCLTCRVESASRSFVNPVQCEASPAMQRASLLQQERMQVSCSLLIRAVARCCPTSNSSTQSGAFTSILKATELSLEARCARTHACMHARTHARTHAPMQDKQMRIIDTKTREEKLKVEHPERVRCVAFDAEGKRVASGCLDGKARIINVDKASRDCGVVVDEIDLKARVYAIAFGALNYGTSTRVVSGCSDGKVCWLGMCLDGHVIRHGVRRSRVRHGVRHGAHPTRYVLYYSTCHAACCMSQQMLSAA